MPVTDVFAALFRRWYLVLVGVAMTGLLAAMTPRVVPVTYEARALMVLLPPRNLENIGGNPYLALGGLDSVVGVLSRSLVADETAGQVREVATGVEYDVSRDDTVSGPVMLITAIAPTEQGALDAVDKLVSLAPDKMVDLQRTSGVRSSSSITMDVVAQDDAATPLRKDQIRAFLAVGLGGIGATVLFVTWLDGVFLRRRARRSGTSCDEENEDDEDDEDDETPDRTAQEAAARTVTAPGKFRAQAADEQGTDPTVRAAPPGAARKPARKNGQGRTPAPVPEPGIEPKTKSRATRTGAVRTGRGKRR